MKKFTEWLNEAADLNAGRTKYQVRDERWNYGPGSHFARENPNLLKRGVHDITTGFGSAFRRAMGPAMPTYGHSAGFLDDIDKYINDKTKARFLTLDLDYHGQEAEAVKRALDYFGSRTDWIQKLEQDGFLPLQAKKFNTELSQNGKIITITLKIPRKNVLSGSNKNNTIMRPIAPPTMQNAPQNNINQPNR